MFLTEAYYNATQLLQRGYKTISGIAGHDIILYSLVKQI
jgi:hypothetical protein